jgi:hypothetical protein
VKRIYVPLPDEVARAGLIQHLMRKQGSGGGGIVEDVEKLNAVVKMTAGYSGSDLSAVCMYSQLLPPSANYPVCSGCVVQYRLLSLTCTYHVHHIAFFTFHFV